MLTRSQTMIPKFNRNVKRNVKSIRRSSSFLVGTMNRIRSMRTMNTNNLQQKNKRRQSMDNEESLNAVLDEIGDEVYEDL